MKHLESQIICEEDLEVKEIKVLSSKEENNVRIRIRRRFKNPLTIITSKNLNSKRKINSETGRIQVPNKKKKKKVFLNLQKVPTKERIKDYRECQLFIREHKSLQRLSELKKIKASENQKIANNHVCLKTYSKPQRKEDTILTKDSDLESSKTINIKMESNEEKRAFAKSGENNIKFFNERPPRKDI